jgi:hypothetical protein
MLKTEARREDDGATVLRTPADIDVKPLFKQGHEVVCSVDGGNFMKGGNIQLPKGQYTLTFNLLDGTPANLNFKPDNSQGECVAFWSDSADCPRNATNDSQYDPWLHSSRTLKVDVDVDPGAPPEAIHYRLNFDNNCYFDPIIIHE